MLLAYVAVELSSLFEPAQARHAAGLGLRRGRLVSASANSNAIAGQCQGGHAFHHLVQRRDSVVRRQITNRKCATTNDAQAQGEASHGAMRMIFV